MPVLLLFCFLFPAVSFAQNSIEKRNRIEELFIWKISEELQLSAQEEKSFSETIRQLNQRRLATNQALAETTAKMAQAKSSSASLLSQYQNLLKDYASVSQDEVLLLKKIIGVPRTAKYLVVKNELSEKLKGLLVTPTEKSADEAEKKSLSQLPPPRLIEE